LSDEKSNNEVKSVKNKVSEKDEESNKDEESELSDEKSNNEEKSVKNEASEKDEESNKDDESEKDEESDEENKDENDNSNKNKIKSNENDRDLSYAEEVIVSLLCPITMERITDPVKGDGCDHVAAFDRKNYVIAKYKECPICKKKINWIFLKVDYMFKTILNEFKYAENVKVKKDNTFEAVES